LEIKTQLKIGDFIIFCLLSWKNREKEQKPNSLSKEVGKMLSKG
jgi:hypothetical protein